MCWNNKNLVPTLPVLTNCNTTRWNTELTKTQSGQYPRSLVANTQFCSPLAQPWGNPTTPPLQTSPFPRMYGAALSKRLKWAVNCLYETGLSVRRGPTRAHIARCPWRRDPSTLRHGAARNTRGNSSIEGRGKREGWTDRRPGPWICGVSELLAVFMVDTGSLLECDIPCRLSVREHVWAWTWMSAETLLHWPSAD